MKISKQRRNFLKNASWAGVALTSAPLLENVWADCTMDSTPSQPRGPFYPIHDQLDKNNDLTRVEGKSETAKGQILYIQGQVKDNFCKPIEGALVEIWQACESGRYDHPGDTHDAELDAHFQYWGQFVTKADGRYLFKTIKPGAYPADKNWMRPPHIHFKIAKRGFNELITQLYFTGEEYNKNDLILQQLDKTDQERVIVDLKTPSNDFEPQSLIGEFDIVLHQLMKRSR